MTFPWAPFLAWILGDVLLSDVSTMSGVSSLRDGPFGRAQPLAFPELGLVAARFARVDSNACRRIAAERSETRGRAAPPWVDGPPRREGSNP